MTTDRTGTPADTAGPTGFHEFSHRRVVGHGTDTYDRCVSALLSGRAHRAAGAPLTGPFAVGGVVHIRPAGIRSLSSPCRILRREEGSRRTVLVYATLPGHLECGEESFTVELGGGRTDGNGADGTGDAVTVTVAAFSRPAHWLTRAGGPVALAAQRLMARRYVTAVATQ